jgi:RNA polymerase sigma-70 factor (ECF subfamily)
VGDRDQKAFEQAALEYLEALYGFALSLARHATEAEDLVQETYLRGLRAARLSQPTGDLKAWLFTILRNIWINQRRRHAHGPEFLQMECDVPPATAPLDWLADDAHRPDALLERRLMRDELRAAIESLAEGFREVIVLRYIEGFSYSQIAQILDCPAGTVMSRISRARAELRRRLSGLMSERTREVGM